MLEAKVRTKSTNKFTKEMRKKPKVKGKGTERKGRGRTLAKGIRGGK